MKSVHYHSDNYHWEVYLVASDEERETLEEYRYLMLENRQNTNPYLLFGQILFDMGLYDRANTYYASLNILHGRYDNSMVIITKVVTIFENHG